MDPAKENTKRKSARLGNDMTKDSEIQHVEICPYAFSHRERRMDGLEEESDVRNLKGGYLKEAKYSVCCKVIVNAKNLSAEG